MAPARQTSCPSAPQSSRFQSKGEDVDLLPDGLNGGSDLRSNAYLFVSSLIEFKKCSTVQT